MSSVRFASLVAVVSLFAAGLVGAACAPASHGPSGSGAGSGTGAGSGSGTGAALGSGGADGIPSQICLLHNCNADLDCAGCSDSHTTCLTSEHRCVACNAGGATGCPSGQVCSSYGNCVPPTL